MLAAPGAQTTKVSRAHAPGLFHTYDVPGLPRTTAGRESDSRELKRRLVSTAGQYGAVKRLQLREGAWELIPALGQAVTGSTHAFGPILEGSPSRERSRVSVAAMPFLVPSPGCSDILGWETYDRYLCR